MRIVNWLGKNNFYLILIFYNTVGIDISDTDCYETYRGYIDHKDKILDEDS